MALPAQSNQERLQPSPFDQFVFTTADGRHSYLAGSPSYEREFFRDLATTAIQSGDPDMIESTLESGVVHQAIGYNCKDGAMPGRIYHEKPGVEMNGHETTYNACDTTPMFVMAAEALCHTDPVRGQDFINRNQGSIYLAVQHILDQISPDGLYWEGPPPGAARFALNITSWKDSVTLHGGETKQPSYPVVHTVAHFMAARSLLSAAVIFQDEPAFSEQLVATADTMFRVGIERYVREDGFTVLEETVTANGVPTRQLLDRESSDEWSLLAFLPTAYTGLLPRRAMLERAARLESPCGVACTSRAVAATLCDQYHGYVAWPQDNAWAHYGAIKHGFAQVAQVAQRIVPHIGAGQELVGFIELDDGTLAPEPRGNNLQLWAVGAAEYFDGNSPLYRERPEDFADNPAWL